jgi:hypothetical protein
MNAIIEPASQSASSNPTGPNPPPSATGSDARSSPSRRSSSSEAVENALSGSATGPFRCMAALNTPF